MSDKEKGKSKTSVKASSGRKALKDFHIFCPAGKGSKKREAVDIVINEGDDLSHVPEKFIDNLKTEGVI
jgi:uncharacterized protein YcgL (UPF0745 family)